MTSHAYARISALIYRDRATSVEAGLFMGVFAKYGLKKSGVVFFVAAPYENLKMNCGAIK